MGSKTLKNQSIKQQELPMTTLPQNDFDSLIARHELALAEIETLDRDLSQIRRQDIGIVEADESKHETKEPHFYDQEVKNRREKFEMESRHLEQKTKIFLNQETKRIFKIYKELQTILVKQDDWGDLGVKSIEMDESNSSHWIFKIDPPGFHKGQPYILHIVWKLESTRLIPDKICPSGGKWDSIATRNVRDRKSGLCFPQVKKTQWCQGQMVACIISIISTLNNIDVFCREDHIKHKNGDLRFRRKNGITKKFQTEQFLLKVSKNESACAD